MNQGDRVQYLATPVVWQSDGSWVHVGVHARDKAGEVKLHPDHGLPVMDETERWRDAEVLDVMEHAPRYRDPAHGDPLARFDEQDVVVLLQAADGQPPFWLNAKLVRGAPPA